MPPVRIVAINGDYCAMLLVERAVSSRHRDGEPVDAIATVPLNMHFDYLYRVTARAGGKALRIIGFYGVAPAHNWVAAAGRPSTGAARQVGVIYRGRPCAKTFGSRRRVESFCNKNEPAGSGTGARPVGSIVL